MNDMGTDWCDARPHPGPLPQEREKLSPRVGGADALGFRPAYLTNDRKPALAVATSELHERADGCSLSPGERVRVRASVITNFKPNQSARASNSTSRVNSCA